MIHQDIFVVQLNFSRLITNHNISLPYKDVVRIKFTLTIIPILGNAQLYKTL